MTIITIKADSGGEKRRIELSDGSVFSFMPCYLPPIFSDESLFTPGTCEGRYLNTDEDEGLRFASACMRAEKAALKLIARSEQSFRGLSIKLEKRGHEAPCIQKVLSRLEELKLVDDERYVKLWLESRISRRANSPRHLLACLCRRGIDRSYAESGIKALLDAETELNLLHRYAKNIQKRKNFNGIINKNKTGPAGSLKYHLKCQGFSSQAIEMFLEQSV